MYKSLLAVAIVSASLSTLANGASSKWYVGGIKQANYDAAILTATKKADECECDVTVSGVVYNTVIVEYVATPVAVSAMPVGIPEPSWGYGVDIYEQPANKYVDSTNSKCDNAGNASKETPLCSFLTHQRRYQTFNAGDIVSVAGGPYQLSQKATINLNGTADSPVILRSNSRDAKVQVYGDISHTPIYWSGQYAMIAGFEFINQTQHVMSISNLVFDDNIIRNDEGKETLYNPVMSLKGHDVTVSNNVIANHINSRDKDAHGIQASSGSYNVWILDNDISKNNGDSFQSCHNCFENTPHHIYIGRNTMYDNRENGVDLKTVHDVVISENEIYGHYGSATSSGDSIVIGSNGYDPSINRGPLRVKVLNNTVRDSHRGMRIEGAGGLLVEGNTFNGLNYGIGVDNKLHTDIDIKSNTLTGIKNDGIYTHGCLFDSLNIELNVFDSVLGDTIDTDNCANVTKNNNIFK